MTTRTATRAVIYTRVSTRRQATDGHGLDSQEAQCRKYADLHGLNVAAVTTDRGISGTVAAADRPGMAAALDMLASSSADVLLVAELSRISRVAVQALGTFDAAHRGGWHVASVKESLDTTSPFGRAMAGILAVFAQLEREQTSERIRAGLAAARNEKGVKLGRRPNARALLAGERAAAIRAEGATWKRVADTLAAEGVATAKGGTNWFPSMARRVARTWEAHQVADRTAAEYRARQGGAS